MHDRLARATLRIAGLYTLLAVSGGEEVRMMEMPRSRLALAAFVCCLSACSATGTSLQLLTRDPASLPEASLRTVAPLVRDEVARPVNEASLKTVAPLLSSEEVQAYASDLKTVAPLRTVAPVQPGAPLKPVAGPDIPVSDLKSGPHGLVDSKRPAPTFRVVTRSVAFATPEQLLMFGRQVAAETFKVPLLSRFGVQSTPDGSAIEHVMLVATEAPGTRLMVVEWVAKELRLWQVEPVEYGGIGPSLAPGLEASLSVTPVLEAWKRERSRLDRQPLAFVSAGVIPKFEFDPTFDQGPAFPKFPWPLSVVQPGTSDKAQGSPKTSTSVTRTVAGLQGHGFRVDWFARPDRSPLAVARTLEETDGSFEEVVFDARTFEVLGVHLPGQTQSPAEVEKPPHSGAAQGESDDAGVGAGVPVFSEEP